MCYEKNTLILFKESKACFSEILLTISTNNFTHLLVGMCSSKSVLCSFSNCVHSSFPAKILINISKII